MRKRSQIDFEHKHFISRSLPHFFAQNELQKRSQIRGKEEVGVKNEEKGQLLAIISVYSRGLAVCLCAFVPLRLCVKKWRLNQTKSDQIKVNQTKSNHQIFLPVPGGTDYQPVASGNLPGALCSLCSLLYQHPCLSVSIRGFISVISVSFPAGRSLGEGWCSRS
ncbi:MAG TPA: hypothetical protein VGN23_12055 [Verrucomicrobiae bacterium]|jgi:hypothetical protein